MKRFKNTGLALTVVALWLTQWLLTGATITINPVQAGTVILVLTSCPSGYDEVAALDGMTLRGTVAAHGDVGNTGGSDLITPSGTVSAPTFTGNALATHSHTGGTFTAAAQTFTGSSSTVGAQTFTGSSSTVAAQTITWPAGVPTAANESAHTHSGSTLTAAAQTVNSLTAAAQTFTGTLSTVVVNHLHTLATGTGSTGNFSQVLGTVDSSSGGTGGTPTQTALGTRSGNPTAGGAANYTPAGTNGTSAVTGTMNSSAVSGTSGAGSAHTHTLSWPAGVPTNATSTVTPLGSNATSTVTPLGSNGSSSVSGTSEAVTGGTPSGTNSVPTFTGTQVANVQAFVKVIFCVKT